MILLGAQLVAAHDEDDLGGELGEEAGLLDGAVAAADDGDLLTAEEEAVAGGAGGEAVPQQARFSASRPSIRLCAPVDTMMASAVYSVSRTQTLNGRSVKSTAVTFSVRNWAPKRAACSRIRIIRSGPMMPSGKPGKFSTSVVSISWPPG